MTCDKETWPKRPLHERLAAGFKAIFSGAERADLIPGTAVRTVRVRRLIEKVPAIPVNAEDPVNEKVSEIPEGFFMNASGELNDVMNAPLHSASPCPNLALKSPATTRPHLKSHENEAVYDAGHGVAAEYGLDNPTEAISLSVRNRYLSP